MIIALSTLGCLDSSSYRLQEEDSGGAGGMLGGDICISVTECGLHDSCCPIGCSAATDPDCSASCGNGTLDPNERCDNGIRSGEPGACPSSCDAQTLCTIET